MDYSLHDCLMSALAMMYYQDPSLLEFQRRLQETADLNNLKTMFGVKQIPGDTQLRNNIDGCDPEGIEKIFADFFRSLQRGKHLQDFQILDGRHLILLDGSEYFSSEKVSCPQCLFKKSSNGKVRYHHQILQAVLVRPGKSQVIPLAPEQIKNEDGAVKQDCEINAAKRILKKIRQAHPKLKIVIGGDDLYSKQPFVEELKNHRMSFVLVAKPADHKALFEWVRELRGMKEAAVYEISDSKGRLHRYEWVNAVPLNGDPKSEQVNFVEYTLLVDGKANYHNSWVTDIEINQKNVVELVKAGRARWKIENETFNTLKNQGYHIDHNFGHGKKNLSYIFFLMNLLAFFAHQIQALTDQFYQDCRAKFSSKIEYWNQLRCTIRILIFQSWLELMTFLLDPDHKPPSFYQPPPG